MFTNSCRFCTFVSTFGKSVGLARNTFLLNNVRSVHSLCRIHRNQPTYCRNVFKVRRIHTVSRVLQQTQTSDSELPGKEKHEFQAETRMLLDIVAKSLYSEKEVFVRELISNASDALEKLRYLQINNTPGVDPQKALEVQIVTNKPEKTIEIKDNGTGMTKEELIDNLGVIARSGSKAFLNELERAGKGSVSSDTIIGQFGVGFYSSFMVADKVEVFTKSYKENSIGYHWVSDGSGFYEISEANDVEVGTRVVVHLKQTEFAEQDRIEEVIKRYSNFVNAPIALNGKRVNTVEALWTADPKNVSKERHEEFYKFISHFQQDRPRYTIHYQIDAPINLRALLYVPTLKPTLFDISREADVGVALYSRRVLIQSRANSILPKWLRFMKGVVDSEDIPLNLSRELLQQSVLIKYVIIKCEGTIQKSRDAVSSSVKWEALIASLAGGLEVCSLAIDGPPAHLLNWRTKPLTCSIVDLNLRNDLNKLKEVLTNRVLKFFQDQMKKDMVQYEEFFKDFALFMKEAIVSSTDQQEKENIAKLMLFESSTFRSGIKISLADYIGRMQTDQREIYYLCAPRELAEGSPYYEAIREKSQEVLFCYEPYDELVLLQLAQFEGKNLVSVEKSVSRDKSDAPQDQEAGDMSKKDTNDLMDWIQTTLGRKKVNQIKTTYKLSTHPCIITVEEMGAARHFLRNQFATDITQDQRYMMLKPTMEINPRHSIMKGINKLRNKTRSPEDKELAECLIEQVFDNAMVAAGLLDDPRSMVGRLNNLLTKMVEKQTLGERWTDGGILTPGETIKQ